MPVYAIMGQIPDTGDAEGFDAGLYRRDFAFAKVDGTITEFKIFCSQRVSTSPYAENTEWKVPKNLSNCGVLVKGKPGTTFQLLQFAPQDAKKE